PLFLILFPLEPNYFLILIVGATVLLVMFTLILMERSFASKGILFGIGYAMVALAIVLFPLFLSDIFNNNYLIYGSELVIIEVVLMIIVSISSLFTSRYLINNKITV
ncbi:MAG: hypothetical protein L0J75_01830, partial [Alkalibacterium sp.]|nr:hypothetical protein [Alkalibacterium sp.]